MPFFTKTRKDKLKKALVNTGRSAVKFAKVVDTYGGQVNQRTGRMAAGIQGAFTGYRPPARDYYIDFTGPRPVRRKVKRRSNVDFNNLGVNW